MKPISRITMPHPIYIKQFFNEAAKLNRPSQGNCAYLVLKLSLAELTELEPLLEKIVESFIPIGFKGSESDMSTRREICFSLTTKQLLRLQNYYINNQAEFTLILLSESIELSEKSSASSFSTNQDASSMTAGLLEKNGDTTRILTSLASHLPTTTSPFLPAITPDNRPPERQGRRLNHSSSKSSLSDAIAQAREVVANTKTPSMLPRC